jgi:hypothetical protein
MLGQLEVKLNYVDAISCISPATKFNCNLLGSLEIKSVGQHFLMSPSFCELSARNSSRIYVYGAWCGIQTAYASGLSVCVCSVMCVSVSVCVVCSVMCECVFVRV